MLLQIMRCAQCGSCAKDAPGDVCRFAAAHLGYQGPRCFGWCHHSESEARGETNLSSQSCDKGFPGCTSCRPQPSQRCVTQPSRDAAHEPSWSRGCQAPGRDLSTSPSTPCPAVLLTQQVGTYRLLMSACNPSTCATHPLSRVKGNTRVI